MIPPIDTAWLYIKSFATENLHICMQYEDCYECDPVCPHNSLEPNHTLMLKNINTKYGTKVSIRSVTGDDVWNCTFGSSEQRGHYQLNINDTSLLGTDCPPHIQLQSPENPYMAILWAFLVYFGLFLLWGLGNIIYKYRCQSSELERALISDLGSPDEPTEVYHISRSEESIPLSSSPSNRRLRSLDAFRGICIIVMVFVEYGGGKYKFFEHARWNGLTIADLVFPWFMWIMGVSSALSIHLLLRSAVPKRKIFFKIFKRSVILFMLGLMLNTKNGCDFQTLRILGVLQRFAVTYFIVSTLELIVTYVPDPFQVSSSRWEIVKDLRLSWIQWSIMASFVIAHELLTFLLDVPGCPKGYLGPGGSYNHSNHVNCTGGAAGYIDRLVLTEQHMYQKPTCKFIYKTDLPYDPEGILGTLTATFMVFLGLQAGKILIVYTESKKRVIRWLVWAVIWGATAAILCEGKQEGGWIPVNKNLWSLSFVLALASLANVMLTLLYVLIDMKHFWSGAPFFYPGMNAIALYIGLEFTKSVFPFGWVGCEDHGCYLAVALWGTTFWVIITIYMHHIKWFISV